MKRKLQPFGDVTGELESVLEKMCHDHDMQHGEILYHVYGWLNIHFPEGKEIYSDPTLEVEFHYGPKPIKDEE